MIYIEQYLVEFFDLLIEMAPWLLLGFLFAGLLHVYMPKDKVTKFMGGKNIRSVINSALLGIPLPLCSCGVIPTSIAFYKEGASKGSTVSFLISTPQTGVDSILVTYSLLGLPFALIRPVVAFFSGIFGGAIANLYDKDSKVEKKPNQASTAELYQQGTDNRFSSMIKYAFHDFLMDIAKWLIIGLAIAALIAMVLPDDFFTMYLDNQFLSMMIVLAASVPIYVCATGSVPIAAVLMMKGLSPGAALVFLMAGPATNAATLAVIGKAINRKTLIIYLCTIILSALLFGHLINNFLPAHWFTIGLTSLHDHHEGLLPYWLKISSGIAITVLILIGYLKKYLLKPKTTNTIPVMNLKTVTIKVKGMTCNHCRMNAENAIYKLKNISNVNANPNRNEVIIEGKNIDLNLVQDAIEDVGFSFHGKSD